MKKLTTELTQREIKIVSGGVEPFTIIVPIGVLLINALVFLGKYITTKHDSHVVKIHTE